VGEIRFYHLQRTTLERALPELLEKCLGRGWRAVVLTSSADRCEALTQHLWTYGDSSFLPHGNAQDGEPERQPIWLTDSDENPNGASVLFLTGGMESGRLADYDLVCDLFDGNHGEALAAARRRWTAAKEGGHTLAYWQQTPQGRWEQKQRVEGRTA